MNKEIKYKKCKLFVRNGNMVTRCLTKLKWKIMDLVPDKWRKNPWNTKAFRYMDID